MIGGVQSQNVTSNGATAELNGGKVSSLQIGADPFAGISQNLVQSLGSVQQGDGAKGLVAVLTSLVQIVNSLVQLVKQFNAQPQTGAGANPETGGQDGVGMGAPVKKTGQFLWKPASDKDGKLAVLLPSSMTGKVKNVAIYSPNGKKVLEQGKNAGVGNGDREHFRFNKPGGSYPDGSIVVITLQDGTKRQMTIKNTDQRTVR